MYQKNYAEHKKTKKQKNEPKMEPNGLRESHQPSGRRWFRGTLCPQSLNPLCPSILNPSISQSLSPWGGVYPFPTLPRGPWTGQLLGVRITFGAPEPSQERSKSPSIFSLIFERVLAPFWLPKLAPKAAKNHSKINPKQNLA